MRVFIGIALILLLLLGCSTQSPVAGGTTDTGNARVSAAVYTPDGLPAAYARVILLKTGSFNEAIETETDDAGQFAIDSLDTGNYSIEINNRKSAACLFDCSVLSSDQTIRLDPDTIRPYAVIRGNVALPPGAVGNTFVRIYGLKRTIPVNAAGTFAIDNLPGGLFHLQIASTDSSITPIGVDSVQAASGATTIVANAGWRHTRRLYLNTTASGVDIAGTVTNFPVLVNLSSANFNFSEAAASGKDLRFTKSDNTPLPYEIERWNPVAKRAEVWVKVDTIYGNNSTQYITMFYGNPDAASESNAAAVFDTADGFMGVWHLGNADGSSAADATANGYDGIPSPSYPTAIEGNIGLAKQFDGVSQYITMPNTANSKINFPENSVYCISAWVYVYTPLSTRQVMVSKGNTQYTLEIQNRNLWAFTEFKDLIGWEVARSTPDKGYTIVNTGTWTLITGIRSGDQEYLYVDDGMSTDTTNKIIASVKSRLTSFDLSIGRAEDADTTAPCYFGGMIDEVRISTVAPNRDWVKLCFRNQKFTDELVQFR